MATLDGLHPTLARRRFEALLADPEAKRRGLFVVSGFRSLEHQKRLWDAAVAKYGSAAAARKWVAPPGRSNHGPRSEAELRAMGYTFEEIDGQGGGIAVDLGVPGVHAVSGQWPQELNDWLNRLAAKHGLEQRMPWEDWHYEPIRGWSGHQAQEDDDLNEVQNRMLQDIHEVLVQSKTTEKKGKRFGDALTHMTTVRNHTTKLLDHFKIKHS